MCPLRKLLLTLLVVTITFITCPSSAQASRSIGILPHTIQGSTTPPIVSSTQSPLVNGGFNIEMREDQQRENITIGDGQDETTSWRFDVACSTLNGRITRALLTLTLTPKDPLQSNDELYIPGGSHYVRDPIIQDLVANSTQTVRLDLLDTYSSEELQQTIQENGGFLPLAYRDDAIISKAYLRLQVVPECVSCGYLSLDESAT